MLMKRLFFIALLAFFSIVFLSLASILVFSIQSLPERQFSVTPEMVYINWTDSHKTNITVSLNTTDFTNITVEILNQTTSFVENYTQGNTETTCLYGYNFLQIQNATALYNTTTLINTTTDNTTQLALIYKNLQCKPGRYYIPVLTIRNTTNITENASISVTVDIPINTPADYFSTVTGVGNFNGQIPINSTYYHSYYFNTSSIENATGIAVTISGWPLPQDIDLFLFDNSSTQLLKARSIGKSTTSESFFFNYLDHLNPGMWEIRIYGNSTSAIPYSGNITFTTLNITNTSDSGKQISSIDFGIMNVTNSVNYTNITLRNEGNISLTNVAETKEFYHIQRFSASGAKNFTFLVPDSSITSKVKVALNWTGGGNYSFNLYNQDDTFLVNSVNRYVYSNFTGAMQEEYNETTSIPSTSGFWRVEVKNNTKSVNSYTLTVYIHPISTWITTNYSTMSFTNRGNSSNMHINISVPTSALNGSYEGYLQYLDNRGAGIKIPLKVDVTTPMLVVNNTLNSLSYRIDENYGVNLTKTLYINITNLGFFDLNVSFLNSTNQTLTCSTPSTCSGYNGTFSFNKTSIVSANNWNLTEVNITFNYSAAIGIYDGWIRINGANDAIINSRPYANFTVNLRLNLTRLLEPRIVLSTSFDGDNVVGNASVLAENVTHKVKIYYINGTDEIEAGNALNTSNFTVWLLERNVSYRIPSTGGLNLTNNTNPLYFGGYYNINSTVPANQPGGSYEVHTSTVWTRDDGKYFTGEGINKSTVIINNTGLYMTTNSSTSLSLSNGTTSVFYTNVTNYGPLAASSATINFTESCGGYSIGVTGLSSGCSGSQSDITFTISPAGHSSSCLVWWTVSAGSSSASACTGNIIGSPTNKWFNPSGINVSVTVTGPSDGDNGDGDGDGLNYTLPTYVAGLAFSEAESLIIVQQNSSNSTIVTVTNTGNISQNINFTVEDINSTWYTLNSTNASLLVSKFASFLVNFNIGDVEVNEYSGKWKAYSVNKTITSDFTLKVLPSEEEKREINDTLLLYKVNLTILETDINQSREEGVNVNLTEAKLSDLKLKIQQAEDYIAQGDYFSAYQLFSEIDLLFIQTRNELNNAIEEHEEEGEPWFVLPELPGDILIYVGIGGGIVAAIILAYLFWPTPTKPKKYIFKHKEEKIWGQLKQKWAKLSKKKEKK